MSNLFSNIPDRLPDERFTTLFESDGIRIERIVSHGQSSPEGFWYDESHDEWVVVLKGAARLMLGVESVEMKVGDFIHIPAHTKHRVEWTAPDEPTVWLAVHYSQT